VQRPCGRCLVIINSMRPIALAAALWMAAAASAQDARLNALHASLVTLHAHAKEASAVGLGGSRAYCHQARAPGLDRDATRLAEVDGDEKAFADRINKSLKAMSVVGAAESQNLLVLSAMLASAERRTSDRDDPLGHPLSV